MALERFQVSLDPRAKRDITEAAFFYEKQKPFLGSRFELEVSQAIERLAQNSFYQVQYASVRCYPLAKFPYRLHFEVDERLRQVTVLALLHTSRNPNTWPQD